MATGQLAQGKQGTADGPLCGHARAYADGAPQRIGSAGAQHMPGEEAWLVGEHRSNGERKYYLSNLPGDTPIKALAGAIKARWVCEQAHQQLKQELGLDHFEGRSWIGLHRHALMSMMAHAFLQARRLAQAGQKKESSARLPNPPCRQCVRPSLTACLAHRRTIVLTADVASPDTPVNFCKSSANRCWWKPGVMSINRLWIYIYVSDHRTRRPPIWGRRTTRYPEANRFSRIKS